MDPGAEQPFEALVNRSFVQRAMQGRDPLGRLVLGGPQGGWPARIVGVVADAREDGHNVEPQPLIYACGYLRYWPDSDILIQTRDTAIAGTAREALRALDPARPVYSVRPLLSALETTLSQARFRTLLISLFSFLALLLAAIGLYGVMAYMVSQRTREIGIRVALGARPSQVIGAILRSGGVLSAAGIAAGIALAAAASKVLAALLYGVRPTDLAPYLAATGVLAVVALVACLIPGRRAVFIHPTEALRQQ